MSYLLEGHTVKRYDGNLNQLHMQIIQMAGLALDQTRLALRALKDEDLGAARRVNEREKEMDNDELKIDEMIVNLIATRSPVALDLRVIMAFSKSVIDLERIGDLASRIAAISLNIYDNENNDPSSQLMRDVFVMGRRATELLENAVEVLDSLDQTKAQQLLCERDELDEDFRSALRRLTTFVMEDSRNVGHAINIVLILKSFERIGEHSRNLVEQALYITNGTDVRHQDISALCATDNE
ncbi:hypothetical protein Tel_10610 [Candidatus Tenderia electrophaga]|jgi:phosphate transport system protein|uniref:Phosphate-specific transport system accessory protein PhoU n=1 Tax=Candidatus Tenderia electrophaga TaxID=1748243 RepID=A0A0S2TEH6_9GAMM|nr:hypothetical protein Tel_10610 [Candidatus Tenderia electrophaga]